MFSFLLIFCFESFQDKACEAFEVFDEMLECEVIIITPHIKATIEFCLEVSKLASDPLFN